MNSVQKDCSGDKIYYSIIDIQSHQEKHRFVKRNKLFHFFFMWAEGSVTEGML